MLTTVWALRPTRYLSQTLPGELGRTKNKHSSVDNQGPWYKSRRRIPVVLVYVPSTAGLYPSSSRPMRQRYI